MGIEAHHHVEEPVPTSAQLTTAEITRMAAMLDPALIVSDRSTTLPDKRPEPGLVYGMAFTRRSASPVPAVT